MYIYITRISLSLFNIEYQPDIAQVFEEFSFLFYLFVVFLKEKNFIYLILKSFIYCK